MLACSPFSDTEGARLAMEDLLGVATLGQSDKPHLDLALVHFKV